MKRLLRNGKKHGRQYLSVERPIDHEKALLSIALQHPDYTREVLDSVNSEMLSHHNKIIYQAIERIISQGGTADLLSISSELDSGYISKASEITSIYAVPDSIKFHAKKVVDFSTKMFLSQISQMIPELIARKDIETDEIIGEVEKELFKLQTGIEADYVDGKQIAKAVMETMEAAKNNTLTFPHSGMGNLDGIIHGFRPQRFYVIGARPGTGKTAFMVTILNNMMRRNIRVGMFSAEMNMVDIGTRYIAVDSNSPIVKIEAGAPNSAITNSLMFLHDNPHWYLNDTSNIPLMTLIRLARSMRVKKHIDILFIDYLSLLTFNEKNTPMWERVGIISKSLKQLSRELKIPVVALSQLTRDSHGEKPNLASLRHSGAIEEDADLVMFLWDKNNEMGDEEKDVIEVDCLISKNRGGKVGTANLIFKKSVTKFTAKDEKGDYRPPVAPVKKQEPKKSKPVELDDDQGFEIF